MTIVLYNDTTALRKKHQTTLDAIFAEPTRANINWNDIENLLVALDADISEGKGSRIRVNLNGVKAVFHRPPPEKEGSKPMVRSVRKYLEAAGVSE